MILDCQGHPVRGGAKLEPENTLTAFTRAVNEFHTDVLELDVHRSPSQILAFGQGAHHCLGNAAARMQARVALEELLHRIPHFSVDVDAVRWAPGPYVRRPLTVPFVVEERR